MKWSCCSCLVWGIVWDEAWGRTRQVFIRSLHLPYDICFLFIQVIYFLHARLGQSALDALSQMITPTCLQGRYYPGSAMGKLRVITWGFLYYTRVLGKAMGQTPDCLTWILSQIQGHSPFELHLYLEAIRDKQKLPLDENLGAPWLFWSHWTFPSYLADVGMQSQILREPMVCGVLTKGWEVTFWHKPRKRSEQRCKKVSDLLK